MNKTTSDIRLQFFLKKIKKLKQGSLVPDGNEEKKGDRMEETLMSIELDLKKGIFKVNNKDISNELYTGNKNIIIVLQDGNWMIYRNIVVQNINNNYVLKKD